MVEINLSFLLISSKPRLPFLEDFISKMNSKSNCSAWDVKASKRNWNAHTEWYTKKLKVQLVLTADVDQSYENKMGYK